MTPHTSLHTGRLSSPGRFLRTVTPLEAGKILPAPLWEGLLILVLVLASARVEAL